MGDLTTASSISDSVDGGPSPIAGDRPPAAGPSADEEAAAAAGCAAPGAPANASTGVPDESLRILTRSPSCSISNSESSCSRTRSRSCFSWSRSKCSDPQSIDWCQHSLHCSDLDQLPCRPGQHFHTTLGHEHIVFDPHTAPARQVGAGLDGEDHAGGHRFVRDFIVELWTPLRDARVLVYFNPESVAGPMTERVAEASLGQRVACGPIDLKPRPVGRYCLNGSIVRRQHRPIHFPYAIVGRTNGNGPGYVDAV